MTRLAIPISTWVKAAAGTLLVLGAVPASAQMSAQRSPDVEDVATTPLTDLNLSKDEIPQLLLDAVENPYASEGLDDCASIGTAIGQFDTLLGPDFDIGTEKRGRISAGRIAQSAIGSLIPFRSIIREISGAADHQRDFQEAILAGAVRRGFLKGLGQQMDCPYPARPAFVRLESSKEGTTAEMANAEPEEPAPQPIAYESRAVVQGED